MKAIIDQRFSLQEQSGTILIRNEELWIFGTKSRKLMRFTGIREEKLKLAAPPPKSSIDEGIFTWDGSNLLVAERIKRKIFRLDPNSGKETLILDPDSLDYGNFSTTLRVSDTLIGDIAWHKNLLYLTVLAGYSSAIYGIDLNKKCVVSHLSAPGPKPQGLDFNPVDDSMYVIDNRNQELRRFTKSREMDVTELPSELKELRGLSIDKDNGLWSVDWTSDSVYRLKLED